jgi:transposase
MLSFCGIDVSKDRLDVIVLPEEQCSSVSNDRAGWADLVERLRGCSIAAIGLEASGGYERGVMRALLAAGPCAKSIRSSFGSLPGRAGFWRRAIHSMPA